MNKQQIEKYQELCDFLDTWGAFLDICNIRENKFGKLICNGYPRGNKNNNLCCAGSKTNNLIFKNNCVHHTCMGCQVKSLSCKGWYCEKAIEKLVLKHSPETVKRFILALDYVRQQLALYNITAIPRHSLEENIYKSKLNG